MLAGLLILTQKRFLTGIVLTLSTTLLAGCMMGPNFHSPSAPHVNGYTATPLPTKTVSSKSAGRGGISQTYKVGQDIPAAWWYLFHSPEINALVETGLANSPNLAAAKAALKQAEEAVNVQIGNSLLPAVNASLAGQRQRFSNASFGGSSGGINSSIFNLYNASVNVSYPFDFFGSARRQVEALQAQVDYQQFQLIAAWLTLTSNIVTTAFTVAQYEAQIKATEMLIKEQESTLAIIKKQFALGGVASTNVLNQQTQVDQVRATLPPLQQSLSQALHSLSVLVGEYPNGPLPKIHLEKIVLPSSIPVSFPSNLVRQRPDIRSSEALLHYASAEVGVATANLFPQFTLTGNFGWTAAAPSYLFGPGNIAWTYAGQLTQPIFHGGALIASKRQAIDAYDQAAEQYRQTLLQAFQNVADTLRALDNDAQTLKAEKQAEISALKTLKITKQQYFIGGVDYLNVLTAQQQYQQIVIKRIQAQATRYIDTAALFQALGGGWWNRRLTICHDPINPTDASTCRT